MLEKLIELLADGTILELAKDSKNWDSLIVNRRKPHTYRVFTTLDNGLRVCLHKFNPCDTHEAFRHPHPWPGAFFILEGRYGMELWKADNREDKDPKRVTKLTLGKWSGYEILDPLTFHSVVPTVETYTVMVNGPAWAEDVAHTEVRRTGGKDLEKMPSDELKEHLSKFEWMLVRPAAWGNL